MTKKKLSSDQRLQANNWILQYFDEINAQVVESHGRSLGLKDRKKNTDRVYNMHLDNFEAFCFHIKCVESLAVLSHFTSAFVPSMPPKVIANYIKYKTSQKGSILLDFESNQPVIKINGDSMVCDGSWKAPCNVIQFQGAITAIHEAKHQVGKFVDRCLECVTHRNSNENSTGCFHHKGQYLFFRRGDPTKSTLVYSAINNIVKNVMRVEHMVIGAYQLLPKEVREIRHALICKSNLEDIQLFVAIIISINLFLRADEMASLDTAKIVPSLCQFQHGILRILYIQVKGKSDGRWITLKLHRKDDCPDLCPIRHLLAYVYAAEIKDGWIFPNLKNREIPLKYNSILSHLKRTCKDLMDRQKNITLHSFRKTGYLFAEWGLNGIKNAVNQSAATHTGLHEVMVSARHKNLETAQRYMLDARGLLQTLEIENPHARFEVPKFEVSAVIDERAHQQCIENCKFTSLYDCATEFVELMGLTSHRLSKSGFFLIKKAVEYQPVECVDQRLEKILKSKLSEEEMNEVMQIISEKMRKRSRTIEESVAHQQTIMEELPLDMSEADAAPALLQLSALDDLPWRKTFRKLNGLQKLELLCSKEASIPENKAANLTNGARIWVINCMSPILECLKNHHGSDRNSFLCKWSLRSNYTKFSSICCSGNASTSCIC
jgi:hypothetical protein